MIGLEWLEQMFFSLRWNTNWKGGDAGCSGKAGINHASGIEPEVFTLYFYTMFC